VVEVEVVGVGAMGGVVEQGVVEEYASQHLDDRRQIIDDFRFAHHPYQYINRARTKMGKKKKPSRRNTLRTTDTVADTVPRCCLTSLHSFQTPWQNEQAGVDDVCEADGVRPRALHLECV